MAGGSRMEDHTGKVFGEWTVVGHTGAKAGKLRYSWLCRCSCGRVQPVQTHRLVLGRSTRCVKCRGGRPPSIIIAWGGLEMSIGEWAETLSVAPHKIRDRLAANWPLEKCLRQGADEMVLALLVAPGSDPPQLWRDGERVKPGEDRVRHHAPR